MMKKAGFKPHVAGGLESAASIGGMFMPPIMGAGGFIMAELTGEPYSTIMLVAVFPALMYFFSVFVMAHYEASRHGIRGEKSPAGAGQIFRQGWFYGLPLGVITVLMLMGYSPGYAAILGLVACIGVSWLRRDTRIGPKRFLEAARTGARNSLKIGATVGVIGIIIGVLTYSGLVLTFADIVIALAAGKLWLTILLIALASLILGMGVPVTAAYLVTAVVAVPPLTELGVSPIAAHMIVYWLSQDSNITPPVCIAAFTGAAIAKANMWKTAFSALQVRQVSLPGAVPVRLRSRLLPGGKHLRHRSCLPADRRRNLGLFAVAERDQAGRDQVSVGGQVMGGARITRG